MRVLTLDHLPSVHRVRQQAVAIAREEDIEAKFPGAMLVVELAALLHDVKDYKYSGSDTAGVEAAAVFLKKHNVPPILIARILHVIDNVSYKKELSSLPQLGEVSVRIVRMYYTYIYRLRACAC